MKIAISSSELLLEVRCIKALSELVLGVGVVQRWFLSYCRESPTNMWILSLLCSSKAASPNQNTSKIKIEVTSNCSVLISDVRGSPGHLGPTLQGSRVFVLALSCVLPPLVS